MSAKKICVQNLHLETFGFLQKVGQGPLALSITDFDMKLQGVSPLRLQSKS